MRDDYYRKMCQFAPRYDLVIDLIKEKNQYAQSVPLEEAEAFAVNAVHSCINQVLFGKENNMHVSTGGCLAVRVSSNSNMPGFKQVDLAYMPSPVYQAYRW